MTTVPPGVVAASAYTIVYSFEPRRRRMMGASAASRRAGLNTKYSSGLMWLCGKKGALGKWHYTENAALTIAPLHKVLAEAIRGRDVRRLVAARLGVNRKDDAGAGLVRPHHLQDGGLLVAHKNTGNTHTHANMTKLHWKHTHIPSGRRPRGRRPCGQSPA